MGEGVVAGVRGACELAGGQKQRFLYHFSITEAPKGILLLVFGCSCLIFFYFCQYFLVYTQSTKIWKEKDTKQIKILVLVLPELGFWRHATSFKFTESSDLLGSKKNLYRKIPEAPKL